MPNTSFWDAPQRVSPAATDRLGIQRGQPNAGEHITLAQVRDFIYEGVSGLTAKSTLTGVEELFIRDGVNNRKTTVSALTRETNWVTFPLDLTKFTQVVGRPLRYKKIGSMVVFSGAVMKNGDEDNLPPNGNLGVLPVGFRPSSNSVSFQAATSGPIVGHNVVIFSTGIVDYSPSGATLENGNIISFDSCFFFID